MKRKFFALLVIALALAVVVAGCKAATPTPAPATPAPAATPAPTPVATPTPAPQVFKFKAVSAWVPTQTTRIRATKEFARLKEVTKGRLDVEVIGGPEIVAEADQLKAIRDGLIDFAITWSPYYTGLTPEMDILSLPVTDITDDTFYDLVNRLDDELQRIHQERANAKVVLYNLAPIYLMTRTKPVTKAADLKGMKIRDAGGWQAQMLRAYGAVPTRVASPEIYSAGQQGIIDGALRPTTAFLAWKEAEVWKYFLEEPFYMAGSGLVYMNLDAYNSLPADLQELLLDWRRTWIEGTPAVRAVDQKADLDFAREHNVQFNNIDAAARAEWAEIPRAAAVDYFKGFLKDEAAAMKLINMAQGK